MKTTLLFILFISFNCECFSQFLMQGNNTLAEQRALMKKNKVKSITIFTKDSSSEKTGEWEKWYEVAYDRNGNEIAIIQSRPFQGIADSIYYDSNNNMIKWIIFSGKTIVLYEYNKNNKIIRKTEKSFTDSLQRETTYTYDSLGNNIEIIENNPTYGTEKSFYKYDNNHNTIEYYSNEDKAKVLKKYDLNSNEIECIQVDRNAVISYIGISTYSENNMTEFISFEYGYLKTHRHYEYDSQGNLTKDILEKNIEKYGSGNYGAVTTYKYNSDRLLIEETHFSDSPQKTKSITKYEYKKY